MKVQVNFKVAAKTSTRTEVFDFIASPTDTIASLKERLATAQRITFPDQDLLFNGEVLIDGSRLCDCGVKESSSLDFVVKASQEGVVKQLIQLLLTCALSIDELSMSYSYKYGESVSQVLNTIGEDSKFEDFLREQKVFQVKDGRVMLAKETNAMHSPSMRDEAQCMLSNQAEQEKEDPEARKQIKDNKTLAKAKDASENHAASKLQAEATLANHISQVFKEEALVFRESRKAFQDALEELEAEDSKQYAPKLVFRESRKAFQDALEELEVEQSQRFMVNQGFKKLVFRETHLAIHLAVEELERSFQ